jgi:hypothetical protein
MTREKKVMRRGRRSKGKDWWGKSLIYSHFSISAVPRFRPTNEKWLNHADKISSLGGSNGRNLMVHDRRLRTEKTH